MWPVILSIRSFNLYSFSFLLGIGFFLGVFIAYRRLKGLGLGEEKIIDGLILGSLFGLVFSRIGFALENYPDIGLSFWPGILAFFLFFVWFSRRQKWDFWLLVDELVYAVLPFGVLSQIGAFLDGSNPGLPTTMPWGVYFPGSLVKVQPLSLFLLIGLFLVWLCLLKIEKRWRTWEWYKSQAPGLIFLVFLGWVFLLSFLLVFWSSGEVYWFWLKIVFAFLGFLTSLLFLVFRSGRLDGLRKKKEEKK